MQQFPKPELLLHPLIPPPLHGMTPRSILGDAWWDEQRHQAAAHNFYKCWACNIPKMKAKKHKWLEGHESYDIDWKAGTCVFKEVVALCHYCHNYIHRGRLEVLLVYKKVEPAFVDAVIRHGDMITAHLPASPPPSQMAAWSDWLLIINGTPYPSRFENEVKWASYYDWLNTTGNVDNVQTYANFNKLFSVAGTRGR